jgi:hypothetical protein
VPLGSLGDGSFVGDHAGMRWMIICLLAACGGTSGTSCPDYMQISGGTFAKTGTTLTWTLDVVAIPATLTFNQAAVADNVREYQWGVALDSDRDGKEDFEVSVTHAKSAGAAEVVTGDILSVTQEDLWRVQGPISSTIGNATVTLVGTKFTLSTMTTAATGLENVTAADQSTWVTQYQFGKGLSDQCSDSWKP